MIKAMVGSLIGYYVPCVLGARAGDFIPGSTLLGLLIGAGYAMLNPPVYQGTEDTLNTVT